MTEKGRHARLSGHWQARFAEKDLYYGAGCVNAHLLDNLPSENSKVFIITSSTLARTTPATSRLEERLAGHHGGTIDYIRQHGPVDDVNKATHEVLADPKVDTIISVGGGSCIDTAKVISLRASELRGTPLKHICIPTTLSGAECTAAGGYTDDSGSKVGFRSEAMNIAAIFYDPTFALYTPRNLWLSTGMRAMDHAVECMYHPFAAEVPWKALALWAAGELYEGLKHGSKSHPSDEDNMTRLMLAVYASSGLKGELLTGGMGLSHSLGHAIGSPYSIPHGITSCMTLAKVVRLKVRRSQDDAAQVSRLLGPFGHQRAGEAVQDALKVADILEELVSTLGLGVKGLADWGVSKDEIPVITRKSLAGVQDGELYDQVKLLVADLF